MNENFYDDPDDLALDVAYRVVFGEPIIAKPIEVKKAWWKFWEE